VSSFSHSSEDEVGEEEPKEIQDFDSGDEKGDVRLAPVGQPSLDNNSPDCIENIAATCFPGWRMTSRESRNESRATPVPIAEIFAQSNQRILSDLKSTWESSSLKTRFDESVSQFLMKG